MEGNIMLVKEQIREISEIATKERTFEKQIQLMKNQWKPIKNRERQAEPFFFFLSFS